MSAILDFYRDEKGVANPSGYSHFDIVHNWSDNDWEGIHDFIQWVFPLKEPSMFNSDAPLLTDEDIAIFKADDELKQAMIASFHRFLKFLGLRAAYVGGKWVMDLIVPGNSFTGEFFTKEEVENKVKVWQRPNHNWLRITRCLHSLRLLGLEGVAVGFFEALCKIYDSNTGVTPDTFQYWQDAAQGGLE
jgi:hypothetical protein